MKTNTYRELQCRFETLRDMVKRCETDPENEPFSYCLADFRADLAEAEKELRTFVYLRQMEGKTLDPISLEWIDQERAANEANERAYGGIVD